MSKANRQEWSNGVKLLSLLLAVLLWLGVTLERSGEMKLSVPIRPEQLPVGLKLAAPLPAKLQVTLSGPRILLCRLWFRGVSCKLDLSSAAAVGTASYDMREGSLGLDRELKVLRINPASVSLTLAKKTQDR